LLLGGGAWNAADVVQSDTQILVQKLHLILKRRFDEIGFRDRIGHGFGPRFHK
jgi:hypothetical protein